jgi:hypothetical protein
VSLFVCLFFKRKCGVKCGCVGCCANLDVGLESEINDT